MGLSWGIAKHSEGAQQHFEVLNSEIRLSLKTQAEVPLGRDVQYTCNCPSKSVEKRTYCTIQHMSNASLPHNWRDVASCRCVNVG